GSCFDPSIFCSLISSPLVSAQPSGPSAARPAGLDVTQKALENPVEVFRRFPEGGVAQPRQAMALALPEVGVGDGLEIVEVDHRIRAAVHHRERNRAGFHDPALIDAFSGAGGLEESLAELAVRARNGVVEETLGRWTKDRADECIHLRF